MAVSQAQDFTVLRPVKVTVRGGHAVLRALREEETILMREALERAQEPRETHSKREAGWFRFAMEVKERGMRASRVLARRDPSPTDLPTPEEVAPEPCSDFELFRSIRSDDRRHMWAVVAESARRVSEFFRRANRLLILKARLEVVQVGMDVATESLSAQLKQQVGAWKDLQDSFRDLDQRMRGYA